MGKLVAIETYDRFTRLQEASGISDRSLTFILDTGQLYTHGLFFNVVSFGTSTNLYVPLNIAGTTKNLSLAGHTHSNYYAKDSDIDIGNNKIVSGQNDILKYINNSIYLGNSSNPTYFYGTLKTIKSNTEYTILDTSNFSVESKTITGFILLNVATIKYGNTNYLIDYVKRLNVINTLDNLATHTNMGTTNENNIPYGFLTMYTDGEIQNPKYALLRVNINTGALEVRSSGSTTWKSASTDTWKPATTSLEGYVPILALNATNTITTQASEYVLTYKSGTETAPVWRKLPTNAFNDHTYTGYDIIFLNNTGTTVDTFKSLTSPNKTLKAGSNVTISATNNVITIQSAYPSVFIKSGSTAAAGLVPKPDTTAGTGKFLCEDGTWKTPTYTSDTNTWREIKVNGTQKRSTSITSGDLDFINGSNTTVEWTAENKLKINSTWTAWKGATNSANGTAGYMPAPTSAQRELFLRGDGSWVSLNNYTLPKSTTSALGGIIVSNVLTTAVTLTSANGSTANRYYGVLLDKDGKAFVNIPWIWNAFTAATANAAGTAGYIQAPAGAQGKYFRGDNTWQTIEQNVTTSIYFGASNGTGNAQVSPTPYLILKEGSSYTRYKLEGAGGITVSSDASGNLKFTGTTYSVFGGASSSADGSAGLVKKPVAGDQGKFLRGDCTWQPISLNVTSALYVGASNGTSTAAQTAGNVHLIFVEGSTYTRYKITGSGRASVTSDANGVITINSSGYNNFTAATSSAAGSAGLVPGPGANVLGSGGYFLRADGFWAVPTNTWKAANTAQEGYVPKLVTGGGAIATQSTEYVLTFVSGGSGTITPVWKLLPTNAFNNTWTVNALNTAGYVAAPTASNANMTWLTDASGNPAWRASNNHSHSYLPLGGGTMTGNILFSGDNNITWARNTDLAKIHFKNTGDGDSDSYLGFETADNGNEYFRFGHTSGTYTEWMSIKSDGVRVKGTLVSLNGHKHAYTDLTGSSTIANQAIVSTGTANGWTLKTLGSRAFDSTAYLPLGGGTMTGSILFGLHGTATYTISGIWTRANVGLEVETPRKTNASDAEILPFNVKTRGGQYAPLYAANIYSNNTQVSVQGHKHAYTDLTGSGTTANQAIVSSGTANGWTLKTLGSRAFDSTSYLPLAGGTMTGEEIISSTSALKFNLRSANGTRATVFTNTSTGVMHGGEDNASYLGANVQIGTWYGFGIYNSNSGEKAGKNTFWHNARTGNTYTWGTYYKFAKVNGTDTYTEVSYNGHKHDSDYVQSVSISGNNLRVTKNNSNNDLIIPYANNADIATRSKFVFHSEIGTGMYVSGDTHIMYLGYLEVSNYGNTTLMISSSFWGNQHNSVDLITIANDFNTNGNKLTQATIQRVMIGGSYERKFYYKKETNGNTLRVHLTVHVEGGNSYGKWYISIPNSNNGALWHTDGTKNYNNTDFSEIPFGGKVSYALNAGSVTWGNMTGKPTSKTIWGLTYINSSGEPQNVSGNLTFMVGSSGMYGFVPKATGAWDLSIYTEGAARLTIRDSGQIGIGKTPGKTYLFDVNGSLNATTLYLNGSSINSLFVSDVSISENNLRINKNGTNTDLTIPYATNAGSASSASSVGGLAISKFGIGGTGNDNVSNYYLILSFTSTGQYSSWSIKLHVMCRTEGGESQDYYVLIGGEYSSTTSTLNGITAYTLDNYQISGDHWYYNTSNGVTNVYFYQRETWKNYTCTVVDYFNANFTRSNSKQSSTPSNLVAFAHKTNITSANIGSYTAGAANSVAWANVTSKPAALGSATQPVYWNGSGFTQANAYPTKSSWNYDDVYLKLSGGTLTGPLTINSSVNNNYNEGIRITRAGNSWAGITFGSTGTSGAPTNGWFAATNPSNQFIINPDNSGNTAGLCLNKNGDLYWRNNVVIHSGNISSYASSGGSSNTTSDFFLINSSGTPSLRFHVPNANWANICMKSNGEFYFYETFDNGNNNWAVINCGPVYIYGVTSNAMGTYTSNPKVVFAERVNGSTYLRVALAYTDFDSYRDGKGLKVLDFDGDDPNVWFEVGGNCYAYNFYVTSDITKKTNISTLSEHIRKFTLRSTGKEAYGVIAQEVPEMFREGKPGDLTVNYSSILSYYVGLLENKVKELELKVFYLELRLNS